MAIQRLQALGFADGDDAAGARCRAGGDGVLGAFSSQPAVGTLFATCDAMLVAGSRLRVPERNDTSSNCRGRCCRSTSTRRPSTAPT